MSGYYFCLLMYVTAKLLRQRLLLYRVEIHKDFGRIDILVNNAGLVIGVDKEFEGNLDEWILLSIRM